MLYAACCFRHALFWKDEEGKATYGPMVDAIIARANREADEEMARDLEADVYVV